MEYYDQDKQNLFRQLRLNDNPEEIDEFIESHKIYSGELHIADTQFWSTSRSEFIRESLYNDSECLGSVNYLDMILRDCGQHFVENSPHYSKNCFLPRIKYEGKKWY
jgi:hypothetical protein